MNKISYASVENYDINENFTPVLKKSVNSENVNNKKWSYNGVKHMFHQSLHWTHDPKKAGQELQQVVQQAPQQLQQVCQKCGQQSCQCGQQAKQEGSRWIENGKHHLIHQGKLWSHDASHWIHNGEHHMLHEGSHWFTNDGNVWTPYTNSHWRGGQNEKNLVDYHPMEYPKATGFEKLPFEGRAITGRWEATGEYK
jgi:hypothetical protein